MTEKEKILIVIQWLNNETIKAKEEEKETIRKLRDMAINQLYPD